MFLLTSNRWMVGTYHLRKTCPSGTRIASVRSLHRTTAVSWPRKDSQHKDSINTEATEYSKSGTDDQAAREQDAAFDPQKTSPETEKETAGENSRVKQEPRRANYHFIPSTKSSGLRILLTAPADSNPLDVSPANPEVSKPRSSTEGGPQNSSASSGTSSDRKRASGGGSPQKNEKGQ
ncbi:MAG: hypothetical protein M1835_007612 [Candelina submexicana]|nr:MAG: hypothetical protein M1835_007612 [Candelina submexicana]